jgi:hypothetical protein
MEVDLSVLVRGKLCPVEIEVFVMVISLKSKEKQNTEACDMGANPLHELIRQLIATDWSLPAIHRG